MGGPGEATSQSNATATSNGRTSHARSLARPALLSSHALLPSALRPRSALPPLALTSSLARRSGGPPAAGRRRRRGWQRRRCEGGDSEDPSDVGPAHRPCPHRTPLPFPCPRSSRRSTSIDLISSIYVARSPRSSSSRSAPNLHARPALGSRVDRLLRLPVHRVPAGLFLLCRGGHAVLLFDPRPRRRLHHRRAARGVRGVPASARTRRRSAWLPFWGWCGHAALTACRPLQHARAGHHGFHRRNAWLSAVPEVVLSAGLSVTGWTRGHATPCPRLTTQRRGVPPQSLPTHVLAPALTPSPSLAPSLAPALALAFALALALAFAMKETPRSSRCVRCGSSASRTPTLRGWMRSKSSPESSSCSSCRPPLSSQVRAALVRERRPRHLF